MKYPKILLFAFGVLFFSDAFAATGTGGGLAYEGWFTTLRTSLTGPFAVTLSLVGILGAGATLIFGSAEFNGFLKSLLFIILIISLLVGANNLLSSVTGAGALISPELIDASVDVNIWIKHGTN